MTPPERQIEYVYEQMDKTLHIMMDRSIWFYPTYKTIKRNEFEALIKCEPRLKGKANSFSKPLQISFGYAQIIFLCTAVELTLLNHYHNSIYFFIYNKGNINNLYKLKQWIESHKDVKEWQKWIEFNGDKKSKNLKEMSFSNLSVANDFLSEIYGNNFLKIAIGKENYKKFVLLLEKLQEKRNGIVHRGGEFKNGEQIYISESDMQINFETAQFFVNNLLKFSKWSQKWWLNNLK